MTINIDFDTEIQCPVCGCLNILFWAEGQSCQYCGHVYVGMGNDSVKPPCSERKKPLQLGPYRESNDITLPELSDKVAAIADEQKELSERRSDIYKVEWKLESVEYVLNSLRVGFKNIGLVTIILVMLMISMVVYTVWTEIRFSSAINAQADSIEEIRSHLDAEDFLDFSQPTCEDR